MNLRQLPKVELHRHLECSLRFSTLKELAPQVGIDLAATDAEIKRQLLVTEPMRDLDSVLKKFMTTQAVLESEEILARITYEIIEDASREGIRILELRYAPTFLVEGHPRLDFEKAHRAILRGAELARQLPINVGFIAIIQRTLPLEIGSRVADFAIDHKDSFVALDLADNEDGFEPEPFAPIFERAKKAGLHITVHSGEADIPGSAQNVKTAIEKLGADRIGHGVQIHRSPEVLEFVKARRVPLELCPTSNWITNAVPSVAAHPFRQLMEAGISVTLNSDDPGVFDIDLTHEYEALAKHQGFTIQEFEAINDLAAACSFLPLNEKQKHWPRKIKTELAPF